MLISTDNRIDYIDCYLSPKALSSNALVNYKQWISVAPDVENKNQIDFFFIKYHSQSVYRFLRSKQKVAHVEINR